MMVRNGWMFVVLAVWLGQAMTAAPAERVIEDWLVLGPAPLTAAENSLLPTARDLRDYPFLAAPFAIPAVGDKVTWPGAEPLTWRRGKASFTVGDRPAVFFLTLSLRSERDLEARLRFAPGPGLRVFWDGEPVGDTEGKDEWVCSLKVRPGPHRLWVQGALPAKAGPVEVAASWSDRSPGEVAFFPPSPAPLALETLLDMVSVRKVSLSPDNRKVAVTLSRRKAEGDPSPAGWLEIRRIEDGKLLFTTPGPVNHFAWLPDSQGFSHTLTEGETESLWAWHLDGGGRRLLAAGLRRVANTWWEPKGRFVVIAEGEKPRENKAFKAVRTLDDRPAEVEPRVALTMVDPLTGARRPLSSAADDFRQLLFAPDGRKILLARAGIDPGQRPYEKTTFVLWDVATGKGETLFSSVFVHEAVWSPGGERILFIGGPSAFAGIGRTTAAEVVPNETDGQAFVYDLKTRQAKAETRDFTPSVAQACWPKGRGIWLKVTERSFDRLYRHQPGEKNFVRQNLPVEAISGWDGIGPDWAVYTGSAPNQPPRLYGLNLKNGRSHVIHDYNRALFAKVRWGGVEEWNAPLEKGRKVDGLLYLPPDFDPAKRWPLIVYYYGGTTPVGREFGGRYPKEWYAARGYVVYVPQPIGCVGYGQEAAAVHVNDWGLRAGEEVAAATRALLAAKPFLDPQRVGAMGASYGGFLTQYLACHTDLFAAYVSHAGISSLTSYWGGGDWGYTYSGVATADGFPWNRKDIYVGQSPLFMADRVTRPILFTHGQVDNNVPPLESLQMYTALKLLGKETALLTFPGQSHFVVDRPQAAAWMRAIMAWFDRWLKGEPQGWTNEFAGPADAGPRAVE